MLGIEARGADIDELDSFCSYLPAVVVDLFTAHLAKSVIIHSKISMAFHIVHGSMNNMKSKVKPVSPGKDLQKLSLSIGNFIRYWGFRRVHGAIWTQLYLSKTPLSCTDLTKRLGLSKALISPALEELSQYKLIQETPAPNEKIKMYKAAEDINEVIRHVLETREAKMLKQITKDFTAFNQSEGKSDSLDEKRVKALGEMIFSANLMLQIMLSHDDLLNMPKELDK